MNELVSTYVFTTKGNIVNRYQTITQNSHKHATSVLAQQRSRFCHAPLNVHIGFFKKLRPSETPIMYKLVVLRQLKATTRGMTPASQHVTTPHGTSTWSSTATKRRPQLAAGHQTPSHDATWNSKQQPDRLGTEKFRNENER